MIVVSDTSPLCYLLLIEGIEILPQLFGRVIIPQRVRDELLTPAAPKVVQEWMSQPPDWLEVQTITEPINVALNQLDLGQEAITLALQLKADLILLDDLAARRIATQFQLEIVGLLGILSSAADKGSVDFSAATYAVATNNVSSFIKVNSITFAAASLIKRNCNHHEFQNHDHSLILIL